MIAKKHFPSPLFSKENRVLGIFTPQTSNGYVLFFYDGHVLNTSVKDLDTPTGIDITECLARGYKIVALSSMINEGNTRWLKRVRELKNIKNDKWVFNEFVNSIIDDLKQHNEKWIGIGFSLSGRLLFLNQNKFDYVLSISPALQGFEDLRVNKGMIFYGQKEVKNNAFEKYNKPIQTFATANKIKAVEIKDMVHDFHSWRDNFYSILNQFEDQYGISKRSK